MNNLQRSIGIFISPKRTLTDITARPNWLYPLMLVFVVSIILVQIQLPMLIMEIESWFTEGAKDGSLKEGYPRVLFYSGPGQLRALASFITICALSVIFLIKSLIWFVVFNGIFRGQGAFQQILSVICWIALVGLLGGILKMPLALAEGTHLIYFSPGLFFPEGSEASILFQLTKAFDIFKVWQLILLMLGLSAIYQFSFRKSATIVGTLFGLLVTIKLLLFKAL
jgi:hypothetical protein